jgi:ABC-2 type transport system permease protein
VGKRIFALMIKEFLSLLKDKKSRVVVIVPPLLQLIVFGYAASFDLVHVPYAVYDEDRGTAAQDLLAGFRGSQNFRESAVITHQEQIRPLIDNKDVLLVLHVSPTFSRDLLRGRPASIQVIIDGRNSNTAMLALNYINSIVQGFNVKWAREHGRAGPHAGDTRVVQSESESRWLIVPGIIGLLLL